MRLTCFMRFPCFCRIYSCNTNGLSNRLRYLLRKIKPSSSRISIFYNPWHLIGKVLQKWWRRRNAREEDDRHSRNLITTAAVTWVEDLSRTVEMILEKIRQNCALSPSRNTEMISLFLISIYEHCPCIRYRINWSITRFSFDFKLISTATSSRQEVSKPPATACGNVPTTWSFTDFVIIHVRLRRTGQK